MADADRRYELHYELKSVVGDDVTVYFQPPESVKLSYPCIIYSKSANDTRKADNKTYNNRKQYSVMAITDDPDDDLIDKIVEYFPYCKITRHYTVDNLYHSVAQLYY